MTKYLAQSLQISGTPIKGPLVGFNGQELNNISDVIGLLTSFLYPIAAILLFLFLVSGGFTMLTSQGDAEKLKKARAKITSAIIGFILLMLSFFIVRLISFIFGIGAGIL